MKTFLHCNSTAIIFLALLGTALGFFLDKFARESKKKAKNSVPYNICRTKECYAAAAYYKKNMDLTADPCNDYYQYVCGGWLKNNKVSEGEPFLNVYGIIRAEVSDFLIKILKSKDSSTSVAVNNTRTAYQSCIQSENASHGKNIKVLKNIIKQTGGFPLYSDQSYKPKMPWVDRAATLIREFSKYTSEELKGFSLGIIINFVLVPGEGIALTTPKEFFLNSESYSFTTIPVYENFVHEVICNMMKKGCTASENKTVSSAASRLVAFEMKLLEYSRIEDTEPIELNSLKFEKKYPDIPLRRFFTKVFQKSGSSVPADFAITVASPSYYGNLSQLINKTEKVDIINFVAWRLLTSLAHFTSKSYRLLKEKYLNTNPLDMKDFCFTTVNEAFGLAISRLFVDNYFESDDQESILTILSTMRQAFANMVEAKKWLDVETKMEAKRKVQMMTTNVGFPYWIKKDAALDSYYNLNDKLDKKDNFAVNYRKILTYVTGEELHKLNYPTYKRDAWTMTAHDVNAQYEEDRNLVTFPLAQFLLPFYWPNTTKAMAYSGASFLLSHELIHSLDQDGSQYDAYGSKRNWWSSQSRKEFNRRKDCLVKQYSSILDKLTQLHLQGNISLADDIADNGAIRLGYNAYMLNGQVDERLPGLEQFDDKKLYFISSAIIFCANYTPEGMKYVMFEGHSPDMYRAILPAANFDEFAKTFSCSNGSKMNRKKRCVLW